MATIKKRVNADGTVRWKMRVYVGRDPQSGKRKFIIETHDRKEDAEKRARKLERMKDKGVLVRPSKEPLGEYLQRWLDEVKEGRVRARTMHDYRGNVRRYVQEPPDELPPIAFIPLKRLTRQAFEELYAAMWKDLGLAPRTIQYLHSILRQALEHAVEEGSLARNPTDYVKPPTQARKKTNDSTRKAPGKAMHAMNEAEVERFLEAAREDRYFALWTVLLMGGLRPGEAFGLLWDDVDLEESRIHVRRALTRRGVDREVHPKGWKLVQPKTKKARRVVVLPAVAVEALSEWRAKQGRERLQLGTEYEDNGLVFTTEFGKPLDGGNLYSRNFRRIMKAARLGQWNEEEERFDPAFRVYDLRHTCATLLLKRGVSAKVVQERLGHANITLTLDTYSHVLPDMQEGAAQELEAMFGSGGGR